MRSSRAIRPWIAVAGASLTALTILACGGGAEATPQIIVQTVVVEKPVAQTVVVEKPVAQTVVVEKQVEKVMVVTATPVQPPTSTAVPAAKPAPPSKQKAGEIIWAVNTFGSAGGGFNAKALCCSSNAMSISETLFKTTKQADVSPYLAESWSLDGDAKSVTVKLRQGVQFHKGFGAMTADDVVWSYNDSNPSTSVKFGSGIPSITDSGGSWTALLGTNPLEKIDPYTVKITFTNFDPLWPIWHFGSDGLQAGVLSKKAFDQKGADWNTDNVVATGPFEVTTFVRQDRVVAEAVTQHWRKVPQPKKITQILVPDETVRQAMMLAGEADIATMDLGKIPAMQRNGMTAVSNGNANIYSIWFTGNLWETTHPTTGVKLDLTTYAADQPWIGNPHTPNDANNPQGMDDMEQARLVRWALAMAVDRDLINQRVVSGLGWVAYNPYFDWNLKEWNGKWKVPYDPKKAGEFLDKAGYPKKADGIRFTIPLFGFEYPRGVPPAIVDAVAGMWTEVGVKVDVFHYDYSIYRPSLVGKTSVIPYIDWDATGTYSNHPWDWPRGNQLSALSRGGKSHSLELPQATQALIEAGKEPDREKRIAINNKFADFLYDSQVGVATIAAGRFLVYNPNKIASWQMEPGIRQPFNTPENIVLK